MTSKLTASVREASQRDGTGLNFYLTGQTVAGVVTNILGPMLEANFRRSLIVSERGPLIFLQSPISAVLLVLAAVFVWYAAYVLPRRAPVSEATQPNT